MSSCDRGSGIGAGGSGNVMGPFIGLLRTKDKSQHESCQDDLQNEPDRLKILNRSLINRIANAH